LIGSATPMMPASLDPMATVGTVQVPNHVKMVNTLDAGATLSPDGLSSSVIVTVN